MEDKKTFATYACSDCGFRIKLDVTGRSVACSEICPKCHHSIYVESFEVIGRVSRDELRKMNGGKE